MKLAKHILLCAWAVGALAAAANPADEAGKAVQSGAQASGQASASAGHSLAATGQLASGLVATPILASGVLAAGVGSAAAQSGGALMEVANRPIGQALPITDETISVMPPNKALQKPVNPQ